MFRTYLFGRWLIVVVVNSEAAILESVPLVFDVVLVVSTKTAKQPFARI